MSTARTKGAKAKCDELFSLIIRAEGVCQAAGYPLRGELCETRCACPDFPRKHTTGCRLQCAHIVTRSRSATRCDEDNALCLCVRHHQHFTLNPVEWGEFVIGFIGYDLYRAVYGRSLSLGKVDWDAEAVRLLERARELGVR